MPLASNFVWTFTTAAAADTTPPTVTGTINANGATNVAINTKVGATFSEVMDPATINATTFLFSQGGTAVAGTVTYAGVNVTFTPAGNLAASTVYTATVTTGAKDVRGNAMAANFVWSWTTAAAPDTTAPTVTGTINANGATNVAINTAVGATFSEVMDPLTITNSNFTLTTDAGAVVPATVSYAGVSAVLRPLGNLANNTHYNVTVKGGASGVKDLAGNAMAADFKIGWTTAAAPDTTAPTVTATAPVSLQTNVGFNTQASVTFSEAMDPLTITNLNVRLQETVSSVAVAGTLSYTGVTATYIPLSALKPNTNYTVTVVGGAGGVKDLAGNPMANTFQVGWTTGAAPDTTAPTVTATAPVSLQTNVGFNTQASVTFSEAMDPLTITNLNVKLQETVSSVVVAGTLSYTGVTATYIPLSALKPNTNYTVTVVGGAGGVKDLAGNPMANTFQVGWTTGAAPDTTAPTVAGTAPVSLQTNVGVNTQASVTFSEAMDPLTVTNLNVKLQETASSAAVPGTLSYTGVTATFIPSGSLKSNTNYTVTVVGGAGGVKDLAGNPMANTFQVGWATGTAVDTTPPTVTLVSPANLAVNVPTNTNVSAVFSEALDPLTITTATFTLQQTANEFFNGTVTYTGGNAIFVPAIGLSPGGNYTARIKGGAGGVKDLAGNAMASDFVWTFATAASVTPAFGPGPAGAGPDLGVAAPFGFFSSAALTNSGISRINGDAATTGVVTSVAGFHDSTGFSIGESSVGCVAVGPCGTVTGTIYANNKPLLTGLTTVTAIRVAALNAYSGVGGISPAARPGGLNVVTNTQAIAGAPSADNLGGRTLAPGIYYAVAGGGANYQITGGDLTLDAGGNPNAVWVFQVADGTGTLTVNGRAVLLTGGAQAKNVYWYVPGGATINTSSAMVGTMIADATITFGTAGVAPQTTLAGRALVLTAGATMVNTVVTVP